MTSYDLMLEILRISLSIQDISYEQALEETNSLVKDLKEEEWEELIDTAITNSVATLFNSLLGKSQYIPEKEKKNLEKYAHSIVIRNIKLINEEKLLVEQFKKAGLKFCIMKGTAAAAYYPSPELRKAADIDILLPDKMDIERAVSELEKLGYVKTEEQVAVQHVVMVDQEQHVIEVHTLLSEPFDNKKVNKILLELVPESLNHIEKKSVMGIEIPVLTEGYHAFELLIHMLQHFLRSGFGVKMLPDWVLLWNKGMDEENREDYLNLVNKCGIKGFSDMITRTCIKYLGLKRENVLWMNLFDTDKSREDEEEETALFLEELKEAGEFGRHKKERMVALRGTGPISYIREFHHQMHLNFPKAGKCFLLWPILWIITLIRFLRNNRKLRKVSTRELFASAAKRSKLVKRLNLFEN